MAVTAPPDAAPPTPAPPAPEPLGPGFRVRRDRTRALANWRALLNPVKYNQEVLEGIMALAGPSFQAAYDAFRADPNGQRLLRERPVIEETLTDLDRLRALPRGTLGHAYADFMEQNRLDAALYDEVHDLDTIAANLGWDDEFTYVIHRGIVLHDLMHVLGGYGPDLGGEFGVLAFTHGMAANVGTGVGLGLAMVIPLGIPRRRRWRYFREAIGRGRSAGVIMAAPYEEWMERPLWEVQRELGISPTPIAHPQGHPHSRFQFGTRNSRMTSEAFAPYEYRMA